MQTFKPRAWRAKIVTELPLGSKQQTPHTLTQLKEAMKIICKMVVSGAHSVGDGVTDDVLEEHLENTARLFVDKT
jgi:hypothetical protein